MKLAVIFAILQMSLGVIMKGFNNVYFKKPIDFVFEFIPQIVVLLALFGWMDLLIIGKWLMPTNVEKLTEPDNEDYDAIALAPSIITTMIDMFLNVASNTETDSKGNETVSYLYVFNG